MASHHIKREDIPYHIASTIREFNEDLRENIFTDPAEQTELMMVGEFFKYLPLEKIVTHVIRYVLPYADQIRKRDENFFLNNRQIFSGLPDSRISHYSTAFKDGRISTEDKAVIWMYFDNLIELGMRYQKAQ